MTTINSAQGLVDDGTGNLTVQGSVTATSTKVSAQTLAGSGSITISDAGFYFVPASGSAGAGYFTGSVPSPGLFPGSTLTLVDTYNNFAWRLTGSSYRTGKALFVKASGSNPGVAGGTGYGGDSVTMSPSGSVIMHSDGFRWCIIGGSGSCALAGVNL